MSEYTDKFDDVVIDLLYDFRLNLMNDDDLVERLFARNVPEKNISLIQQEKTAINRAATYVQYMLKRLKRNYKCSWHNSPEYLQITSNIYTQGSEGRIEFRLTEKENKLGHCAIRSRIWTPYSKIEAPPWIKITSIENVYDTVASWAAQKQNKNNITTYVPAFFPSFIMVEKNQYACKLPLTPEDDKGTSLVLVSYKMINDRILVEIKTSTPVPSKQLQNQKTPVYSATSLALNF